MKFVADTQRISEFVYEHMQTLGKLGLARADKIGTVRTHDFWTVRSRTVLGRSGTIGPSRPQDRPDFGPSGRSERSKTVVLRAFRRAGPPKHV